MITRYIPESVYHGVPCSIVAVGTALGYETEEEVGSLKPIGIYPDGYLPLEAGNKFIRQHLPVAKREYFKRGQRPRLGDILAGNKREAIICCYGHLIYADGESYYSFFENVNDDVVSVWWLKE